MFKMNEYNEDEEHLEMEKVQVNLVPFLILFAFVCPSQ